MTETFFQGSDPPAEYADVNFNVAGFLRDMAFAQTSEQKMFGYKRAAAAVLSLEEPVSARVEDGTVRKIPGVGPASTRIILEVLSTGRSEIVDQAVAASSDSADILRRRALRSHFLSRAAVLEVLANPSLNHALSAESYRGDLQMHSEWSDGKPTLEEIVSACLDRGYSFAAVTDHSHGLRIAGGMSMADAANQRLAIESLNAAHGDRFRLIRGIEANIAADGRLDLSMDEAAEFELVLAAPHSALRKSEDQTERLVAAVRHPHVHVLAHPRGRIAGARAGVIADWDVVFRVAADEGVAVEIDGDPARQDLDYAMARKALAAGCLFALDSDAHTTDQFRYTDTAIAHARLAGIPGDRVINCWPVDRLLQWLADRSARVSSPSARRDTTARSH
jgi:histidinol phosphatase-like PHP family hydrolase